MKENYSQILSPSLKNNLWTCGLWLFTNIALILLWWFLTGQVRKIIWWPFLIFLLCWNIINIGVFVIPIHWQYFNFEKNRTIKLEARKMIINCNDKSLIISTDSIKYITLFDRVRIGNSTMFRTSIDRYYYLIISLKNGENIIITCLMDRHLKKTIESWSDMELKHQYQFFPFIKKEFLKKAASQPL